MSLFAPAVRYAEFARIGITGPSGSGRTETALRIAQGLGGPVAVLDTERGRSRSYAERYEFSIRQVSTFHPSDFLDTLAAAAWEGVGTLVVDCWSSYWSGLGGILSQVDDAKASTPRGSQASPWAAARQWEAEMDAAIAGFPGHLVFTLRAKTEWMPDPTDPTKSVKVGMKPEQREGFDYALHLVGDMDMSHHLTVAKSTLANVAYGDVFEAPGEALGAKIAAELSEGEQAPTAMDCRNALYDETVSFERLREMVMQARERGLGGAVVYDGYGKRVTLGPLMDNVGRQRTQQGQRA